MFPSRIITTDVPDSCVILRAHTPVTALFDCIWFNENVRFTPRDQFSVAYVMKRIVDQVGLRRWKVNMFPDCERHNFVFTYHHDQKAVPKKEKEDVIRKSGSEV